MKKLRLFAVMILSSFLLSGCFLFDLFEIKIEEVIVPVQLETPVDLRINDTSLQGKVYLFCDPVENASSYEFSINYDETQFTVQSDTYSLDITERIGAPNEYTFSVKSVGDNVYYLDSEYSGFVGYDTTAKLTAPTLNLVNDTVLTWNVIADADNYVVKIIDKENSNELTTLATLTSADVATNGRVYDFELDIVDMKPYYFVVMATSDDVSYEDSLFSNEILYTEHMIFNTPTELTLTQNVNDVTLSWTADSYAQDYTVLIDGTTEVIVEEDEQLNVTDLISVGQHTFSVKSNSYGYFEEDSEYSVQETYTYFITLDTPTFDMANRNGSDIEISWSSVTNAVSYTLIVNEGTSYEYTDTTTATGVSFADSYADADNGDTFTFVIKANGSGYYLDSNQSEEFFFNGVGQLYAPTNISLNGTVLTWDAVDYAEKYEIALNNETFFCYTNIGETTGEVDLDSYMKDNEIYDIKVRTKSSTGYYDSEYSDGIMYNNSAVNMGSYTESYFYYYGYHDYYITSQDELDSLIGYVCTYRIEDCTFYYAIAGVTFGGDGGSYDIALNNYAETKPAIGHSYTSNGNVKTITQTYYSYTGDGGNIEEVNSYPEQANEVTDTLEYIDGLGNEQIADINEQFTNVEPNTFTSTRDNTYNDFASEEALVEVTVYNSDQLFMVIQSNAKPVFVTTDAGSMQASDVYEAVKDVLREIVDDNMTDYEKVLAIHDWIMYNTNYDHIVANCDLDDSLDYGVFYLEGVFLEDFNGLAVCDGFSKAFSVMCEMEGIEAIKINGTASGGNHAWNKVYLSMDDGATYNWYNVDITWGDANYTSGEILTHEYFLLTDDEISVTHTENSGYPSADTSHDYYDYYEYEDGYDFYITMDGEIEHLVDYLVSEGISSLEVEYSGYTFSQIKEEIKSNLPTGITFGPIPLNDNVIILYWY